MARNHNRRDQKPWHKLKQKATKRVAFSMLIVCEGQTEEHYFESFNPGISLRVKISNEGNYSSFLDYANALSGHAQYDERWLVLDYDENPNQPEQANLFDQFMSKAIKAGFKVAYSNDAFELWIYLHYTDVNADSSQNRRFYYDKLSTLMDVNYHREGKTAKFTKNLYHRLSENASASQPKAIERAQELHEKHEEKRTPHSKRNPMTLVYQLVKQLNELYQKCQVNHT